MFDRRGLREDTLWYAFLTGRTQTVLHDSRRQISADQFGHRFIVNHTGNNAHELVVVYSVEEFNRSRLTTHW